LNADSSWEKVVFNPWQQIAYDANDTVLFNPGTDQDVGEYFQRLPASDYLPTWYEARKSGELGRDEQSSAMKTAVHFDTPTVAHFDALGRAILTIEDNGSYGKYATHVLLDIEGNHLQVIDAKDRIVMRYNYDMINTQIYQSSMEGGERWTLNNAVGNPFLAWNSRNFRIRTVDDPLHRRILSYLQEGTSPERQVERIVYGETLSNPEIRNQRGKTVQIYDQAGLVVNDDYDFKGNLLSSQRQFAEDYKTTPDWSFVVPLEAQLYTNYTEYDALNRVTQLTTPDDSLTHLIYNEANFIGQVQVSLHAEITNSQRSWTPFVTNIEYDPKGQRTLIAYGNGIHTRYTYDHYTFRLNHLKTRRDFTPLQDLHYTYDPVGNVTHIRDDAQQTVFFRNNRVDPSNDYTYDPIYRLVEATGREHLGLGSKGQTGPPPVPNASNAFETRVDHPGNGNAMQSYFEKYIYDSVNNILAVKHDGSDATHPGWTRSYNYNEPSQLEPSKTSNRLSSTAVGGRTETYSYDGSAGLDGLMTKMPQLSFLQWDYKDQLQTTSRQVIQNGGTPETTWYVYDGSGQRVRKITERQSTGGQSTGGQKPTRMKERIYLGVFEIYREYENDGSTVSLERETLHVMDDKQRIALVETRTQGTDDAPEQLMRYQFGNLLGSVCLELDEQAQIISYEEYYPFGSTSYQAVRSKLETPKRYRYTGKERDEESGLYYYGARYYASWLGRWISCDPKGIADGDNLYHYVHNNPIKNNDPTGTLTLGQWSGIAAAVVVGTVLTVATAGLAGPVVGTAAAAIIGGIVGGAAGGAVGAAVESKIDQGHVDMDAVGKGALVGAITGGVLSGGGVAASAIARSTIGRAVGTGIAKSAAGQFVGNTAKSVTSSSAAKAVSSGVRTLSNSSIGRTATSAIETGIANPLRSLSEYTEGLGSRFSLATGIGKEASRQAGLDATGARLGTMLKTGPSGGNKAIAAAEISGPEYKGSPVLRTRSGMATPAGEQEIPHVPLSKETHFHTFPIPKGNGDMSQEAVRIANFKDAALNQPSREVDAEVRMYDGVTEKGAKKLNMAVNKPMCMSCVHATFQFLGDNPGLELNLWAPPSVGDSFLDLGSLGPFALTPSVTKATVAGATGAVAGTYNAF
jgi:RHS repeat-associated protein